MTDLAVEKGKMYGRYSLEPREVPRVETEHRRIVTAQPAPDAVPILERLLAVEPPTMACLPPVLWDRAEGYQIEDPFGNRWIDWSSCVLVANAGHAPEPVVERVRAMIDRPLLSTFAFPHEARAELCERLVARSPEGLEKVFLFSTGSEAIECMIKMMRTWGRRTKPSKKIIVSFSGGFHGRTLGAQYAGGIPPLKEWIGVDDQSFLQVQFPDGYLLEDTSFSVFEKTIEAAGVDPSDVAGVMSESFLGVGPDFFPKEYAQALRRWCDEHGALLAFDEVQAGYGRSGRFFAFEHYDIAPDLFACGKGMSSSLPLSGLIGRADVLSTYPPGTMTSTHAGAPLSVAAGLGCLDAMESDDLVAKAAALEGDLLGACETFEKEFPEHVGAVRARGLVGGIRLVRPGTLEADADLAYAVTEHAYHRGLLMLAPVGLGGGCLKIAPPLVTPREALFESFEVLTESMRIALA